MKVMLFCLSILWQSFYNQDFSCIGKESIRAFLVSFNYPRNVYWSDVSTLGSNELLLALGWTLVKWNVVGAAFQSRWHNLLNGPLPPYPQVKAHWSSCGVFLVLHCCSRARTEALVNTRNSMLLRQMFLQSILLTAQHLHVMDGMHVRS